MLTYIQRCGARLYDDFLELRPGAAKELEDCLNGPSMPLTSGSLDGATMQSMQQRNESPEGSSTSSEAGDYAPTEIASTVKYGDRTQKTQDQESPRSALQPCDNSGILPGRFNQHNATHSCDFESQVGRCQSPAVINIDPEGRWVLTCTKSSTRQTGLTQVDVCRTASDKEYFETLKRAHLALRNWPSRIFSLTTVKSIRFVQVSISALIHRVMYQILTCH